MAAESEKSGEVLWTLGWVKSRERIHHGVIETQRRDREVWG
jgi:hypothetical protein